MFNKSLQTGFNNGELCPLAQISIPVDNLAIGRAYAAYEFFKIIRGKAFYLDRHLDRFSNSLDILKINIAWTRKELQEIILKLIHTNGDGDFQIKMYAIPMSPESPQSRSNLYILPCSAAPFDQEIYHNGTKLLMKEYCRFVPEAKSTNYIASVFWKAEMDEMNAIDVLYYKDNQVLESSRGNIFVVKNGNVQTPSENILKGITRGIVIDLMRKAGIAFKEQSIAREELSVSDEIFITSTTKLIMPIIEINHETIGKGTPGPITRQISKMYLDLLN